VRLLSGTVYYLLLLLAAARSLIALGVPAAAVLAVVALILVVFAVALQQSAVNFAATVIFLMFQPFRRDELILTMGYMSWVQEILLFDTVLRLPDQRLVSMPNSRIHDSGIGQVRANFTLTVNDAEDVTRRGRWSPRSRLPTSVCSRTHYSKLSSMIWATTVYGCSSFRMWPPTIIGRCATRCAR
jgi:small-conductance mechanosensitive channel